jgi:hypothetical protein
MKLPLFDRAGIEEENRSELKIINKLKLKEEAWRYKRRESDENKIAPILNDFTKTR